ncbi:MAG: HAD hydrolase-like protein [Gemmatimonadales bacterium]
MPASSDWIVTTRQALPDFFRLVRRIRPSHHLPDIRAIDDAFVRDHRVEALIWDVDGTLMPHHDTSVAPEFLPAFMGLVERPDLLHAILSNSGEERFLELGRIFPDLRVFKAYRGPSGIAHRLLWQGKERWTGRAPGEEIGDPLRPLKKPSAELVRLVLEELGSPAPERTFMVGDQYFTDIAGANLAGIGSIKVPTLDRAGFPLAVKSFQRVEELLYRLLYGKG